MQLSDAGLNLIKRFEGFRAQTYFDLAGLATIGYGHKLMPGESFPQGVGEPQAAELLANDVRNAELAVQRLVNVLLSQPQFDALVDFVFNLGAGRLQNSTLLRMLNAGDYASASEQLLLWDHAAGEEIPGLKARRESELALWSSPEAA
jgi:GH24 family phage-related lysozyme (muramidase)